LKHSEWCRGRLYDEVLHGPLIISGPESDGHTFIKDQVSLLDLGTTIVDLLNIPKVESFLGTSLLPLINGKTRKSKPHYVISETLSQNFSCRTTDWKYITDTKTRHELYNLQKDPEEKKNVAEANPEKVKELSMIISKHVSMVKKANPSMLEKRDLLSAEEQKILEERLKSLGYL
jgi:arylsulfatase A-like enzyme